MGGSQGRGHADKGARPGGEEAVEGDRRALLAAAALARFQNASGQGEAGAGQGEGEVARSAEEAAAAGVNAKSA